ncbi:hypothetical protein IWX48DRAFT_611789, partial [Phyllosticta citricarpa]
MVVAMPWMPPPMAISRRDRGSREHGLSATGRKTPLFFFFSLSFIFRPLSAVFNITTTRTRCTPPDLLLAWPLASSPVVALPFLHAAWCRVPVSCSAPLPFSKNPLVLLSRLVNLCRRRSFNNTLSPYPTRPYLYLPDHRPGLAPNPARWKGRLLPFGRLLAL